MADDQTLPTVTDSCGCVWRDLNLPCKTEGCRICHPVQQTLREQQLETALHDLMVPIESGTIIDGIAGRAYRESRQAAEARKLLADTKTNPVRRSDPLWAIIFNAIPASITDEQALSFSRRAAMADAAWRIAQSAPQIPQEPPHAD